MELGGLRRLCLGVYRYTLNIISCSIYVSKKLGYKRNFTSINEENEPFSSTSGRNT